MFCCQPDSCQAIASASLGSTPCLRAVATIIALAWVRDTSLTPRRRGPVALVLLAAGAAGRGALTTSRSPGGMTVRRPIRLSLSKVASGMWCCTAIWDRVSPARTVYEARRGAAALGFLAGLALALVCLALVCVVVAAAAVRGTQSFWPGWISRPCWPRWFFATR